MPNTNLLKQFGLSRNPFTDRTAEKTSLDEASLYIHSDLQAFTPSETTYVFFGRRGSGKTTIRMAMQKAYQEYNEQARHTGRSKGHFMVDLCRPGHMTACLRCFQETVGATDDNWDAQFGLDWSSSDVVDCILSYAVSDLVSKMTDMRSEEGRRMLDAVRQDDRASKQFLILAHIYAKTDAASLATLRRALLRPRYSSAELAVGVAAGTTAAIGLAAAVGDGRVANVVSAPFAKAYQEIDRLAPALTARPRLTLAALTAAGVVATSYYMRFAKRKALERARELIQNGGGKRKGLHNGVRIVKQQSPVLMAYLLGHLFSGTDRVETIRGMCIGISAHQKLELLERLVLLLGYESIAVFGDCFDEVSLLDPVQYPSAIKAFAREVCRNDLLNFGRLHFFFPDSRLALDLNTDKTLKEARFDRHFVRDLMWSRHQLEELAERRFVAAQQAAQARGGDGLGKEGDMNFTDLFKKVKVEDFSSYLAKLSTPRELMIMMTEMFSRIEANPEGGLTSQDMEIAVTKALEQAV